MRRISAPRDSPGAPWDHIRGPTAVGKAYVCVCVRIIVFKIYGSSRVPRWADVCAHVYVHAVIPTTPPHGEGIHLPNPVQGGREGAEGGVAPSPYCTTDFSIAPRDECVER